MDFFSSNQHLQPRHQAGFDRGWESAPGETLQCNARAPIFRHLSWASEMAIILTWLGGTFVALVCILPFIWIPVVRGDHRWYTPPKREKPAYVGRMHRWIQFAVSVVIVILVLQGGYAGDMNLRYYRYCREPVDRTHDHSTEARSPNNHSDPSQDQDHGPWKGYAKYSSIPGAFALSMIIWIFGTLEFLTLIRSIVNVVLGYTKRQVFLGWWWWPPTPMFVLITSPVIIVLKCCLLPLARHTRDNRLMTDDVDLSNVFITPPASKRTHTSRKHSRGNSRNTTRSSSTVCTDEDNKVKPIATITEDPREKEMKLPTKAHLRYPNDSAV